MKLGIFGGSFDPVHNGHVNVAKDFLSSFALDKLLIIPTGIHPRKPVDANDDPQKRIEMCRLAFKGINKIEVSDIEVRRKEKSYTVLTLRELKKNGDELYLLCGTDMLLSIERWYCFEEILALCTLVCVRRKNDDGIQFIGAVEKLKKYRDAKIATLEADITEISSSDIRSRIRLGESVDSMIPENVYDYITLNKLYQG